MLLDDILSELAESGVRCMQTRFVSPPVGEPYIVYDVEVRSSGADFVNLIREYRVDLSLIESPGEQKQDPRDAIEAILDSIGVGWVRSMREWSEDEHVYVTMYEFSWSEKK